jgi:hypothetical protein
VPPISRTLGSGHGRFRSPHTFRRKPRRPELKLVFTSDKAIPFTYDLDESDAQQIGDKEKVMGTRGDYSGKF